MKNYSDVPSQELLADLDDVVQRLCKASHDEWIFGAKDENRRDFIEIERELRKRLEVTSRADSEAKAD